MKHTKEELDRYIELGVKAAKEAGEYSLKYFGKPKKVTKKGEVDLVTEVDIECERIITEIIKSSFPNHFFFGEETSKKPSSSEAHLWVIDPIDGTTNFAHGYPKYSVSIGLRIDGQTVAAVVYEPLTKNLYTAHSLSPSRKNGEIIEVSNTNELIDSLVITGFYYDAKEEGGVDNIEQFSKALKNTRAIRRDGSAVMNLCYIAEGCAEAFWEHSLQAWDVCAGALIVEKAGGIVSTPKGQPYDIFSRGWVVASNKNINDKIRTLLF